MSFRGFCKLLKIIALGNFSNVFLNYLKCLLIAYLLSITIDDYTSITPRKIYINITNLNNNFIKLEYMSLCFFILLSFLKTAVLNKPQELTLTMGILNSDIWKLSSSLH